MIPMNCVAICMLHDLSCVLTKFVVTLPLLWCHVTMCYIVLTTRVCYEMTSFMRWHHSCDDICHVMTSVMCYISSVDCNIQPQPSSCCDQHVMCFFFCYNKPAFWLIQLIFDCFCFYWVISIWLPIYMYLIHRKFW